MDTGTQSTENTSQATRTARKSRPKPEKELLKYAQTPRGAYRLKKAYRMARRL